MFSLVSGAYKYFTRKDEYCVLILGLDNSGKTTLLEKIKHLHTGIPGMPIDKIQPTVGVNISKVTYNKDLVKFMDMGGQPELRSIWKSYYEDSHAILFVIDSTDTDRMEEARECLLDLVKDDELDGQPLLVLANKSDLTDASNCLVRVKEMVNGLADCMDSRDARVMEASGIDGTGVLAALEWLHDRIVENRETRPPISPDT